MASRSWPHGMTTTLSLVVIVPVGAPVVLVPVVLEVLAAVPVVVPVVSVVPVVVSAVEVAVPVVVPVVLVVPVVCCPHAGNTNTKRKVSAANIVRKYGTGFPLLLIY